MGWAVNIEDEVYKTELMERGRKELAREYSGSQRMSQSEKSGN